MLQPFESSMDGPQLSTPSLVIRPELMFTPLKDLLSPHKDHIIYYEPDESGDISNRLTENSLPSEDSRIDSSSFQVAKTQSPIRVLSNIVEKPNEEITYEMVLSIDEEDKKRFISLQENASEKSISNRSLTSKRASKYVCITIEKFFVVRQGKIINLEASDELELYTQDMNSVVKMNREQFSTRNSRDVKKEPNNIAPSSSKKANEKFLHALTPRLTPSKNKTIHSKSKLKHISTDHK